MPKRDFYIRESELDDYQVKIINRRTDNSFIVKGCAGSGKSILALWKAKQIQDDKKGSFLFIVYAKALLQYMKDGINQIGLSPNNVQSLNQCFHWTNNDGIWEKGDWKKGTYDYIIIDEVQDLTKEDLLTIKSYANKALLLYGDAAQQLYSFRKDNIFKSMEEIADVAGLQMEQLVFNHRLPKKIARLAEFISGTPDDLEGRCRNEGVEKPKIMRYLSIDEQLDAIAEIIKNRGFEDVGVLFRSNKEVIHAAEYLRKIGMNIEAKVNENVELNFNSTNPKLMTYHSAKGLQFEAVFVPDCLESDEDNRNALYVAITRTYQSLYIMHSGTLSSFFDDIPTTIFETSLSVETELL
ncbi:3'-5' exonuclease [Sphingobacterium sp. SG20118]|uniref:3'-5' exonuclease n=1 Tax=Sphingobacterium sp. SG20118 TaxID=3367156 RepID=UPI0037DFC6B8